MGELLMTLFADIVIWIYTFLFVGFAGRVRGGYPKGRSKLFKYVAMIYIGAYFATLVTNKINLIVAASILVPLLSYRWDMGWKGRFIPNSGATEEEIKTRWLHAARSGATTALPMLPLAYWDLGFLIMLPAFVVGSMLGIYVATTLPPLKVFDLKHAWPWSEILENLFPALIINIVGIFRCL